MDRGPDARGVIETCLRLRDAAQARTGPGVTFLRGNHEVMALRARAEGGHTLANWLYNGGGATLLSYGHPPGLKTHGHSADERPIDGWAELVPDDHWALEWHFATADARVKLSRLYPSTVARRCTKRPALS